MPYASKEKKAAKDKQYRETHRKELKEYFQTRYRLIKQRDSINVSNILFKDDLSYTYTQNECLKEFEKIKQITGTFHIHEYLNKIVLTYQPHFYGKEKQLWNDNKNDIRQWLVNNRIKYINKNEFQLTDKDILRGFKISGKHIGYSHFHSNWIRGFINNYNITSIYDPCMGWGHRLLGAHDIRYIGNDIDKRTYDGNVKIASDFKLINKTFYNNDCTMFTPIENYEAVFTCPPYYNVEIYNNGTFQNLDKYKDFWNNTIKSSLKDGVKYFAYVINQAYIELTKQICIDNKLVHIEDIGLSLRYNHFQRTHNNHKKGEILVIFKTEG